MGSACDNYIGQKPVYASADLIVDRSVCVYVCVCKGKSMSKQPIYGYAIPLDQML